jgi:ubiquinone/menaquinone biosynthesis C-methylase UbiE
MAINRERDARQQREALAYFRSHAPEWSEKASGTSYETVNVIKQRNEFVLHVIDGRSVTDTALDVGCGSGDLVLEIANRGIKGIGVDYAPEMIAIAKERAGGLGQSLVEFHSANIFELELDQEFYDCVSANGFIEYISWEQLNQFALLAHRILKPGGSLVLGSRNRLFNIFSLNDFTKLEADAGTLQALLRESIAISGDDDDELATVDPAPLAVGDIYHRNTGIDVSTRLQYTPVQLMRFLEGMGFQTVQISPIHIHGLAPRLASHSAEAHTRISNLLHADALANRHLIPQSSSFMIHATKAQ